MTRRDSASPRKLVDAGSAIAAHDSPALLALPWPRVNELARRVIESLRTGDPRVEDLARAGAPAPAEAAAWLGAAARDRDLAARVAHWCPALIASADPGARPPRRAPAPAAPPAPR